MDELKDIIQRQHNFQKFLGWPIDSNLEEDRNRLFEIFIFKLIEEAIELRKETPSVMNPWSKKQKEANHERIKEEMSDVFLFFLNLMITWKLPLEEFIETVHKVQANNVLRIKEKKMKMLNERILNIPGYTSGIGQGNLSPKYVFVGINPAEGIEHGYKVWSNPEDGSSKILLPILKDMGILEQCYFTNLVKCVTEKNREPLEEEVRYWSTPFDDEIDILKNENRGVKIITMGSFSKKWFSGNGHIQHPAYVLRGGITKEDYEKQIKETIASLN